MHTFLLELYQQALPLSVEAAGQARQRDRQILSRAELEEPPPAAKKGRGRPKSTPGRNLLRRLREHEDAVLAFALVEGVPFTNNQAERDLRPAKVKQNVSGCFRTGQGATVHARLQAVISTCRKQERNVFATLRALRPSASLIHPRDVGSYDHRVIKSLGLKFKGRNAWPLFRSYRPAHFPWYLTADEARFLTLALQQAREVCLRFRENHALLDPPQEDLWFVRVPEKTEQGFVWKDTWLTLAPFEEEVPVELIDELRLARFTKEARRVQAVWEVDLFFYPLLCKRKKTRGRITLT